ncbi:MAG: site-2 protease family protein [Chloroflexota bacterium]
MKASFRIGRIAGIDIGVNASWILAFVLITWSLAVGFFPSSYGGWSQGTYWVAGIIAALLLFASVLVHELAHSLVARSHGMAVSSITLFIFGGVSNLEEEPGKAISEFMMAIVGPLASLGLAGLFWVLARLIGGGNSVPAAIMGYLSLINALLAGFNLIPGFPLDGGRVLRSIIWGATKDLHKATNVASMVGQVVGWMFIAIGFYQVFAGNFLNGIWIGFIGWFLNNAADASRRETSMREYLRGVRVRDVMDPSPECTSPDTLINDVVQNVFFQRGYRAAPVCDDHGVMGIVTITDVKKLPQQEWADTPVAKIMTRKPLYSVKVDDDLSSALKLLAQYGLNQLIVMDKKEGLAGLLNRAHVIRYIQLNQELKVPPKPETDRNLSG